MPLNDGGNDPGHGYERVVNIEKTNVRYFDPAGIEAVDFISIDVSFISLGLILLVASRMLKDEGELVCQEEFLAVI